MTAYGSARLAAKGSKWRAEVHSVNRKLLDISVHLPRELLSLDLDVRKSVGASVHRGQVTVRIHYESEELQGPLLMLKSLKAKWQGLAKKLGFDPAQVDFRFLADRLEEGAEAPVDKALKGELEKVLGQALEGFVAMREKEGAALAKDLQARLKTIRAELKKIEGKTPTLTKRYEERLKEKLGEPMDERLLKEVVIYADRVDTSEEITRLHSHLDQFSGLLQGKKEAVIGRTLDFLTQEMGREINTLGAKAADVEITRSVILVKSEIEKIREQVQNIE